MEVFSNVPCLPGEFRLKVKFGNEYSGRSCFHHHLLGNIWNDNFRKSRVLPDKLVAMVTPSNLMNQKWYFWMLHRLILKVTKFQLPPPKCLSTGVKNILGLPSWSPMSNRVKELQTINDYWLVSHGASNSRSLSWRSFGFCQKLTIYICWSGYLFNYQTEEEALKSKRVLCCLSEFAMK